MKLEAFVDSIVQTLRSATSGGRVEVLRSEVTGRSPSSASGHGWPVSAVLTGAIPEGGNPERSVGPDAGASSFGSFCQDKRDPP
ncbi:hypothetical protein E1573_08965 [Pseudomonas sp. H9]|nr:hypothetical protein E1573_08965 [Pseudomonas sp. H9]